MTTRLTLAVLLVTTSAAATAVITRHHHHHVRPVHGPSATPAPTPVRVPPPTANRSTRRAPLPTRTARSTPAGWRRWLDITAYCATGNRTASGTWPQPGDVAVLDRTIPFGTRLRIADTTYTVRDWIGHGSDVDLFLGADPGCETRARNYGRRHLEVVEVTG